MDISAGTNFLCRRQRDPEPEWRDKDQSGRGAGRDEERPQDMLVGIKRSSLLGSQ